MNTQKKQSSNVPANEVFKNQILNTEDDFLNSNDSYKDEEDLKEEAENPVDSTGNDFNEIEEENEEEVE